MPTQYPTALDTQNDLLVAVNNWGATVMVGVTSGNTEISLSTVTGLQTAKGLVAVEDELIYYAGLDTVSNPPRLIGCVRGFDGTTAAAHGAGVRAEIRWVAAHHNYVVGALLVLESVLGVTPVADPLNGQIFATLAARLAATLPVSLSKNGTNWGFTHDRRRHISIQLWRLNGSARYELFTAPVEQEVNPAGIATVIIALPVTQQGYLVYH